MKYNLSWINVAVPEGNVTPKTPLPECKPSRGSIAIVSGRGPVWRYARILHELHGSPAPVVCTYDPRLGAVVVMSHHSAFVEGDVLEVEENQETYEK